MHESSVKLDVTHSVEAFLEIISYSWGKLALLSNMDKTESFMSDWAQANWERIVEGSIDPKFKIYIDSYGSGADCNIRSSRVWNPNAIPTHRIVISYVGNDILLDAVNGNEIRGEHAVGEFCSIQNGWPVIHPPFDHVTLADIDHVAIPVRNLRYFATPLS